MGANPEHPPDACALRDTHFPELSKRTKIGGKDEDLDGDRACPDTKAAENLDGDQVCQTMGNASAVATKDPYSEGDEDLGGDQICPYNDVVCPRLDQRCWPKAACGTVRDDMYCQCSLSLHCNCSSGVLNVGQRAPALTAM